jgi:hypothetical protein
VNTERTTKENIVREQGMRRNKGRKGKKKGQPEGKESGKELGERRN